MSITTTQANDNRLANAQQLVERYRDGHEPSTDELAMVVEAGLLSELLAVTNDDEVPLWPHPRLKPFLENKPTTRSQCKDESRPCPWVSCRYHLAVDVYEETLRPAATNVRCNPLLGEELDVFALPETCALDVAARGESTLEDVGSVLGVTRTRVRQIEMSALAKLRGAAENGEITFDDE